MDQLINITTHSQQQQMKLAKDIQALYSKQNQSEESRDPYSISSANHSTSAAANQSSAPPLPQQQPLLSESLFSSQPSSLQNKPPPLPETSQALPPPVMRKKRPLPHQRASVQGIIDTKPKVCQSSFDEKTNSSFSSADHSGRGNEKRNRNSLDARYFSTNLSSSPSKPPSSGTSGSTTQDPKVQVDLKSENHSDFSDKG